MTNIKNANIKQNSKESPRNIFSRTETKFDSKLMTMATIMRERLAGVAAGCASLRGRGGGRRLPRFGGWWGFVSGGGGVGAGGNMSSPSQPCPGTKATKNCPFVVEYISSFAFWRFASPPRFYHFVTIVHFHKA